jgi:hypothetical protein
MKIFHRNKLFFNELKILKLWIKLNKIIHKYENILNKVLGSMNFKDQQIK